MADKVIVVGAKRGNERVPSSEIMQMIGRAGRRHDGGREGSLRSRSRCPLPGFLQPAQ